MRRSAFFCALRLADADLRCWPAKRRMMGATSGLRGLLCLIRSLVLRAEFMRSRGYPIGLPRVESHGCALQFQQRELALQTAGITGE
jgi:hypothetical protein